MSPFKAFGTVAVMVACFVIIYPRFMHPFVLRACGLYEPPKKDADDTMYPPHFKATQSGASKHPAAAEDARKHMRQSPPHPGMRAAAEMQRQQGQQGSGRGMMGVVLPMYAIGIVLYLVYTLFKVFNKPKNDSWEDVSAYENRMERDYPLDSMGLPSNYDGVGDMHNIYNDERQRKQLEHLLTRIDDKNVSLDEMRMLQKRLEETEAQMCKILKAMQAVHTNVDANMAEDLGESKEESDDLNPDMKHSKEVEGTGVISEKQVKHGEQENGRKTNLVAKDEVEPSGVAPEELTCGSQSLQQDVSDNNGSGDEPEVEGQGKDKELASASKVEDVGDENNSSENTETKVRHRKGKHDNEQ